MVTKLTKPNTILIFHQSSQNQMHPTANCKKTLTCVYQQKKETFFQTIFLEVAGFFLCLDTLGEAIEIAIRIKLINGTFFTVTKSQILQKF